ncbi:sulfurtransferase [Nocardioides pocheonensis]|uniref:Sulfurtransferase n=1 Tax=Nocardioides pocheonensis TaxID=661485 RepID=A0A3N0GUI9_9ACTN|nr:sulfurtransferase [Nocardioides pocheonensis]RNM16071.1 sulfurtransferase [Nocardioides pocheonensis]
MRDPLISAAELARLLPDVTVLDVRYRMGGPGGPEEYTAGHVPGAAYVDLDTTLADPPGPRGRHPLPDVAVFEAAMRRAGVSGDRPVVVYDDWEGRAAARCWWLLRHHGHPDVRVLDGGLAAWTRADGPVETGTVETTAGSFTADPGHLSVVDADGVLALAATGTLVDARNPERYRGEVEPVDPVAGRIPGAVNVPTGRNVGSEGTFRTADQLRDLYGGVVRDGGPVAAYCGSGVTAAHDILAMAVAGIDSALYPGSWSEWVADPSRPVETG